MAKKSIFYIIILCSVLLSACATSQTTPHIATNNSDGSWSPFFDQNELDTFIKLINTYFENKSILHSIDNGIVTLIDDEMSFGLLNIAQICSQSNQALWPELIEEHFNLIFDSFEDTEDPSSWTFEEVREILLVRLYPEDILDEPGEEFLIFRRDIPGTISALVYDFPTYVKIVPSKDMVNWGTTSDEIFQIALENTYHIYHTPGIWEDFGNGIQVHILISDNFFVASQALVLEHYKDCQGVYGSLVGIPVRDTLLCYPINNEDVVNAITLLIHVISGLEQEGPGSLSSRLYWYHDGSHTELPYDIHVDSINFYPPEEFVEMLNELAP